MCNTPLSIHLRIGSFAAVLPGDVARNSHLLIHSCLHASFFFGRFLMPKTGTQVKLDVGYLYGSTTGNKIARRAYWANNSFTSNVTDDIPHESRLEPAQWGRGTVE